MILSKQMAQKRDGGQPDVRTVQLTVAGLRVLIDHLERDLRFGTEGTFGDGETLYAEDFDRAKRVLAVLKQALG